MNITVPFDALVQNTKIDARKSGRDEGIAELAASIGAIGLTAPLTVRKVATANGHDRFEIVDGNRRHAAIATIRQGMQGAFEMVPVLVRDDDDVSAREASLAANVMRVDLTPVDEIVAFTDLAQNGRKAEDIAAHFGITTRRVKQRLALGTLAPEIIKALRADEIDMARAECFTLEPRHERQIEIFNRLKKNRALSLFSIRGAILDQAIPAESSLALFIGEDHYLAAGGTIREDLFGEDRFWESPALVPGLLETALTMIVADLQAQGWDWVEVERDGACKEYHGRTIAPEELAEADAATLARIEALEKRNAEIFDVLNDDMPEEEYNALHDELNNNDEVLDTIKPKPTFSEAQRAMSGCVIQIQIEDNAAEIIRGVLTAAQVKARTATRKAQSEANLDEAEQEPSSTVSPEEADLTGAVLDDLSLELGGALQQEIALLPAMAPRLLLAALILSALDRDYDSPFDIALRPFKAPEAVASHTAFRNGFSPQLAQFSELDFGTIVGRLELLQPHEFADLLASLTAHAVSVHAHGSLNRVDVKDLVKIVSPDARNGWQVTREFLKRLKREQLIAALAECGMECKAKKPDLVEQALTILPANGWLPTPLRSPAYDGPGSEPWLNKMPTNVKEQADGVAA